MEFGRGDFVRHGRRPLRAVAHQQFVAAWAYWGFAIFPAYVRALARLPGVIDAMEPDKDLMHSLSSSLQLAGLPLQQLPR